MQHVLWAQRDRFLSAGPSSLVPNRRGMKGSLCAPWQQETCTDHVDSFRWTVPKRNTNYWFFFSSLKPQTRSPKFPQQIKSKLLKGWFTLALISVLPPSPDVVPCLKEIQQRGTALKMSITQATWHSNSVWFRWRLSGRKRRKTDLWVAGK